MSDPAPFPYEFFARGHEGAFFAGHIVDDLTSDARTITEADLVAIAPRIQAGLIAAKDARIAELEDQVATLQEQLAAALAPPASPPLISQLGAIYEALSEEVQDDFLGEFSIIRNAIQAGLVDSARRRLAGLELPAELESTRSSMLALFV